MAPKHEPTSDKEVTALRAEYQHLLEENDALRIENVQLRRQLRSKDQTIDHLELKDHARTKRMGDLHEQVYQLGVAKADLETDNRNLKLDKEHLLESLTEKQQYLIDKLHEQVGPDILGEALERARTKLEH